MTDYSEENIQLGGSNFLVRIQFRQNASWQGTIQWLDKRQTKHFRSMLEMMMLIQDALEKEEAGSEPLRTWENKEHVS